MFTHRCFNVLGSRIRFLPTSPYPLSSPWLLELRRAQRGREALRIRPISTHHHAYGPEDGENRESSLSQAKPAKESVADEVERENLATSHSRFVSQADTEDDWDEQHPTPSKKIRKGDAGSSLNESEKKLMGQGRGKLSPTSTHLFKLLLPLPGLSSGPQSSKPPPPTVYILHPSQPLSHVARLIQSSLPSPTDGPQPYSPRLPTVSFQNRSSFSVETEENVQWSDSTDIGDFVREAARSSHFDIVITPDQSSRTAQLDAEEAAANRNRPEPNPSSHKINKEEKDKRYAPLTIPVEVPTFSDRTRFLRKRLTRIDQELEGMQKVKDGCDKAAHKSAQRLAITGFGALVFYWIVVFRLTFFTSLGWDFMEPVTYLTEFLFILGGYVWFLRQGREVSYSSILNRSVSTRRQALYESKGLDIERWADLMTDKKALQKQIQQIAEDYEVGWKESRKSALGQSPAEDQDGQDSDLASSQTKRNGKGKSDDALSGAEQSQAVLDDELLRRRASERQKGMSSSDEASVVENRRKEIIKEEEKEKSSRGEL